ncbi:ATP-binding protein [Comamonadaceae bacterium M7527]|nr:ATP-binding protein [Comamonadaceae bacterium M7527]
MLGNAWAQSETAPASVTTQLEALKGVPTHASLAQVAARTDWATSKRFWVANGYGDTAVWLRLTLRNTSALAQEQLLSVGPTFLDDVHFFWPSTLNASLGKPTPAAQINGQQWLQSVQGDTHDWDMRAVADLRPNMLLTLQPNQQAQVYVRVASTSSLLLEPSVQSIGQAMMSSRTASLVTGALAGIGFVVAVAALILWLNTRLQTYLVFSIVSLVVMAYISASNGWWSLVPALRNPFGSSLLSACVGFYVGSHAWLTAYVLNLRTNMPITGRVLRGVSYICAMLGLLAFTPLHAKALLVNVLTGAILPLITLSLVAHVVWRLRAVSAWLVVPYASLVALHIPLVLNLFGLELAHPAVLSHIAQSSSALYLLMLIPFVVGEHKQTVWQAQQAQNHAHMSAQRMVLQGEMHAAQTDWVTMMAHELKTPLSVIDACRQSVERVSSDEQVLSRMAKISVSTQRVNQLVTAMLNQHSVHTQSAALQRQRIQASSVIRDIFAAMTPEDQARVQWDGSSASLLADPALIRLALDNLLRNALEHGDADQAVQLTVVQDVGHCVLSVSSAGQPIPSHLHQAIFGRFSSGTRDSTRGVGLWASRTIARAHQGEASVRYAEDRNIFEMRIPSAEAEAA